MIKKIAVLRGINVGGKRKILMADLRSLCETLGLINVKTYIQSGNLIFESNKSNTELENILEKAITEKFGFDVPVIVRAYNELKSSVNRNPFINQNVDINQLHLIFLKENPSIENIEKTLTYNFEPDQFEIENKEVFLRCPGKYHQSKLSNTFFEKELQVSATTRNWKTVSKLLELIEA